MQCAVHRIRFLAVRELSRLITDIFVVFSNRVCFFMIAIVELVAVRRSPTVARRHQEKDVRRRHRRLPSAAAVTVARARVTYPEGLTSITNGRPSLRGRKAYEEASPESE